MEELGVVLVYLEVEPLTSGKGKLGHSKELVLPVLTGPTIQQQLTKHVLKLMLGQRDHKILSILWDERPLAASNSFSAGYLCLNDGQPLDGIDNGTVPVLYLNQESPLIEQWPCICRGFAIRPDSNVVMNSAVVSDATIIRILPHADERWKYQLTGECPETLLAQQDVEEILACQNDDTIQQLSLTMNLMLARQVHIGTCPGALESRRLAIQRHLSIQKALRSTVDGTDAIVTSRTPETRASTFEKASLIVHSPDHSAGKTALVEALANRLQCQRIHKIRPGALFAKFGAYADSELERIVHEVLLSAAFQNQPCCIILDQLDAMMPASLTGCNSSGDAASPALNGILCYLQMLTRSLERQLEVPFPTKNRPSNPSFEEPWVLPVRLCVVAVLTCPDRGWQAPRTDGAMLKATILDSISSQRQRLADLTPETRLAAIQFSLEKENLMLTADLEKELPFLAASSVWLRAGLFRRLAKHLSATSGGRPVNLTDFANASEKTRTDKSSASQVEFLARSTSSLGEPFKDVGGNQEAKAALEDALALDSDRRERLHAFGLSPPTGVLLYGTPGCGKTLLAKSVALLLRTQNARTDSLGGAFISLASPDLVRAEVGTGEKILVSAFKAARLNSPSVIFIDEFQALFTERNSSGSGRLTTTLLHCIDDIHRWADVDREILSSDNRAQNRVVILAATNTPWMVDKAFLRPGRFDRCVHVGLPDMADRSSILQLHIGRMKLDDSVGVPSLCKHLAMQTIGFSGADLAALCRAAAVRCLSEGKLKVQEGHFHGALREDVKPSSDQSFLHRIEQWKL